ncbi:MAG: chorismate-binding protein, partial [Deltaproteobacteria bacterium]|nr:chorismate-binding protein [Deltaproteobacteria bacterium]
SGKNDAELSMIVDLLRNDLGKVCRTGSVRVAEHKRLEAYRNVYHLVSRVEGRLDRGRDSVDLITAAFPGGSVTGCPKIRAMEIIDELEPIRRHVYTGGIGYISFHDTMDLSIAIRTATIHNNKIVFSVGGGIVFDSDPEEEYCETLDKGRTMMEVFRGKGEKPEKRNWVWLNGRMVRMERASLPIADQGFLYGYGFFETIRMVNGNPRFLEDHIARFHATWRTLFGTEPPDLTWRDIIMQVMRRNGLGDGVAAVKIIVAYGKEEAHRFHPTLVVMAAPHTHRLTGKREAGLDLAVYPYPRQNPLADHKTLNYLYYLLAGKWARSHGADEALIMNADGTVSETNSGTLIFINGKTMIKPVSSYVLPGVIAKAVSAFLAREGYGIVRKAVRPEEVFSFDEVLVTNSLMGAVPVLRVDGRNTKEPSDLWQKINNAVW